MPLLFVAVLVIFLVALVIINNALVMATLERVREIGTLRAVGAQRSFILGMLLVEGRRHRPGLRGPGLPAGLPDRRAAGDLARGIPATTDVLNFFFSGPRLHRHINPAYVLEERWAKLVLLVSMASSFYPRLARDAHQPAPGHGGRGVSHGRLLRVLRARQRGVDILVAFRNLIQHTRRTIFLLAGAIAAVTALMVLLKGLSAGTEETMLRSATTLMTGHVNVGGFYKVTECTAAPVVTDYLKVLEVVKRTVPELDYVAARGRGWSKIISDTSSIQCGVSGIDIRSEPGFKEAVEILSGDLQDLAKPDTILIFESQAKKLDVRVGDALTMSAPTTRGVNNTADVRVSRHRARPGAPVGLQRLRALRDAAGPLPLECRRHRRTDASSQAG